MWGIELAVMVAMIGVNSVFAGYEIALASVTATRLRRLADEGRRGAAVALSMKQNMEASLAVVQLGITLVGAIAAAVGGAGAGEVIAPLLMSGLGVSESAAAILAIALVVLPLTFTTIIFGELIPKVFALRNSEWVCLKFSPLMRWFSRSVWPAVWLLETVVTGIMSWGERRMQRAGTIRTESVELQELRAAASLVRASRLIGPRAEGIILSAADLQARPVREIMLPAEHINTLDANASLGDNLVAAHLDMHTRFPVEQTKGDRQSIVGYVNVKDIVANMRMNPQDPSLRSIIRPLLSLNDRQPISECLEQLMREHTHIALIRDDEGRVLGMISLEDILEELVGDIEDEYDRLPAHVLRSGLAWVAGGGVGIQRLKEITGIDLGADPPAEPASTLNDWVVGHLKREVRGGDILERGDVRVAVRKVRRKKLQEAQVSRATPRPPAPR